MSYGTTIFFSDWKNARQFVLELIAGNNRITSEQKTKLYIIEKDAYDDNAGAWLSSEKTEINNYFRALNENFRAVTDDEKMLNVIQNAVEGSQMVATNDSGEQDNGIQIPIWAWFLGAGFIFWKTRK